MIFHGDNPTLVTREPALATTPASELLNGSSEWAGSSEEADSGGQVQGAAPFLIELVAVYTTGNTTEEPGYRWPGPGPPRSILRPRLGNGTFTEDGAETVPSDDLLDVSYLLQGFSNYPFQDIYHLPSTPHTV